MHIVGGTVYNYHGRCITARDLPGGEGKNEVVREGQLVNLRDEMVDVSVALGELEDSRKKEAEGRRFAGAANIAAAARAGPAVAQEEFPRRPLFLAAPLSDATKAAKFAEMARREVAFLGEGSLLPIFTITGITGPSVASRRERVSRRIMLVCHGYSNYSSLQYTCCVMG